MEDCELRLLHHDPYDRLCAEYPAIAQFFRHVSQQALAQMMTRMSNRLKYDAAERYDLFLATYERVVQRISLGDMANFLGITQVSLSRIRAGK